EAFVFQMWAEALAFPSWALVVGSAGVVLAAESFEGAVGQRVVEEFVLQAVELLRQDWLLENQIDWIVDLGKYSYGLKIHELK
ncbi:MAG: hypothetical protein ACD_50C00198G0009, partial [uncultured bacterium]